MKGTPHEVKGEVTGEVTEEVKKSVTLTHRKRAD
jgi:hypothetical protein